ncbi:hypothetical protein NE237_017084 [Protea cynaroides]|uniref:Zinc knuckle CX2CX4HX4C domain-containing protein n=1 Tax=Protea cynaroides TaxID=273540 RepID=A0A9Q0QMH3_9MAGN|nr:hypothetical protein NE237_017084 [Protea cynaroides]
MIIEGIIQGLSTSFLRVRVTLEINKPLRHSISIQGKNGKEWLATVKYERLPAYCFFCGIIGHEQNRCKQCYEADQAHMNSHGCDPLSRCPQLPARLFGAKVKGSPPSTSLLERARLLELQDMNTGGAAATKATPTVTASDLCRRSEIVSANQQPKQVQSSNFSGSVQESMP